MARQFNRLTTLSVKSIKEPGYHGDGNNLYLQVSTSGGKSWIFRFMLDGKRREMGLGGIQQVSLAEARIKAAEAKKKVLAGEDPVELKALEIQARRLSKAQMMTFDECAATYIAAHAPSWSNEKHVQQWTNTLAAYVSPLLGSLPVASIDTQLVLKCLEPIWYEKTETASRIRGRLESILSWATVRGFRKGDNPARWRGHLDTLLPSAKKIKNEQHHAAIPYAEMPSFFKTLHLQQGVGALAFEFCILTATRTNETLGARWEEFNLTTNIWKIPPSRTKTKKEYRVPLSQRCLEILELMKVHNTDFVFPGMKVGRPLSNTVFLMLLRRVGLEGLTGHGCRSSFRDWCAEMTNYSHELGEMALGHVVSDKTEAAYLRGDLLRKRFQLMNDWADYCAGKPLEQSES